MIKNKLLFIITLFATILFMPKVYAEGEVEIRSIEVESKTETTELLSDPKAEGLLIKSDVEFKKVNDYIEYKVKINNPTDKDYTIKENENTSKYITYEYRYDEENKIVEKEKDTIVFIKIKYNESVPEDEFEAGIYTETEDIIIDLIYDSAATEGTGDVSEPQNTSTETKEHINPITGDNIAIWTLTLTVALSLSVALYRFKKNRRFISIILLGILILPFSTIANEKKEVKLESKVTIQGKRPVSETIYWALKDNDSNGTAETLIIADHELTGITVIYSGSFSGDKQFAGYNLVPWTTSTKLSKDVTTVTIDGIVVPKYTSNWFYYVGENASTFSADLTNLDTNNVSNMTNMFIAAGYNATIVSINGLSSWDTSKVTDMSNMFEKMGYKAKSLTLEGLNNWNVSKAENMNFMFAFVGYDITNFDLDLSNWKASNVSDMTGMFYRVGKNATTFNLKLDNWDTSNVTNMSDMFESAGETATTFSINGLSSWDTSKVTDMSYMFIKAGQRATTFNIDLSSWNTLNVTNMHAMFSQTGLFATEWSVGDISSWNTSKVTDMSSMFANVCQLRATTFNLDLNGWNTSKVENMVNMFYYTGTNATTWQIKIPRTNGNGINNTTTTIYGKDLSALAYIPPGRSFTLAD